MTEEEYRRAQVEFGQVPEAKLAPAPPAPPLAAAGNMSEEDYLAAEVEFGAVPEAKLQEVPKPPPEPATLGQNLRQAVGGPVQGVADATDLPYYASQGIDAIAGWIPDNVKEAFNAVSPITSGAIGMFQDAAGREGQISEKPGLKQAKEFLAPEFEGAAPWAKYARTAGEWAGPGALASVAKQGLKRIPKALANARADIYAGTGAAGGAALGDQYSETGGTVGELAGGLSALIAAVATGKRGGLSKAQAQALQDIENQFDNPAEVIAEVRRRYDSGEIGTVGDLSREEGIFDIEALTGATNAGSRRAQNAVGQARINQIYDETLAPLGIADREMAPLAAEQAIETQTRQAARDTAATTARIAQEEATAQAGLAQTRAAAEARAAAAEDAASVASRQADEAAAAAAPGRNTVEISESASGKLNAGEEAFDKDVVRPAWDEFEAGPRVPTRDMAINAGRVIEAEPTAVKNSILEYPPYKGFWADIRALPQNAEPKEIQDIVRRMKAKAYSQDPGDYKPTLVAVIAEMEKTLAKQSPLYRKGVAATKELKDRFQSGRVKGARTADEPETLLSSLGTQGDRGAATTRILRDAQLPELDRDIYDFVLAEATRKGENITPEFLSSYEGAIARMPAEDQAKLQRLVETKESRTGALTQAKAAQAEADKVSKVTQRQGRGLEQASAADTKAANRVGDQREKVIKEQPLNQLATRAESTVNDLVNKPDNLPDLKALTAEIDELGQLDSFKALIRDNLEEQLFVKSSGSVASRKKAYQNFQKVRKNLVDSGVLTKDQADDMTELLARTETTGLRQASRASKLGREADEKINLAASGAGAAVLAALPASINTLMIGGAVRRSLRSMLQGKVTAKRVAALDAYLTDPGKYLAGLDSAATPEEVQRLFLTNLIGAGQAAEIVTGE